MDVMGQLPALLFALFAILVLIVGLGAVAARLLGSGRLRGGPGLNVLASTPLGGRERAVLIGVGERRVLVGVTQQAITPLMELSAEDIDLGEADKPQATGFAAVMGSLLSQGRRA